MFLFLFEMIGKVISQLLEAAAPLQVMREMCKPLCYKQQGRPIQPPLWLDCEAKSSPFAAGSILIPAELRLNSDMSLTKFQGVCIPVKYLCSFVSLSKLSVPCSCKFFLCSVSVLQVSCDLVGWEASDQVLSRLSNVPCFLL